MLHPRPGSQWTLSKEDDQFLDDLEKTNFQYFWEQANPKTGLVKDRCNVRNDNEVGSGGEHSLNGVRADSIVHWRQSRLHSAPPRWNGC